MNEGTTAMRDRVVIMGITGFSGGGDGEGIPKMIDRFRAEIGRPLGIPDRNLFHTKWNNTSNPNPTSAPDVPQLKEAIEIITPNPSYVAVIGHSFGAWAATRLSRALANEPDFVGLAREVVLFIDSVYPTQATKITSGWIRKGVEKMIATVAGRSRINLTGAIDLNTMSIMTREYETINGSATVDFLKAIEAAHLTSTKVPIIADGGGAHTSKEVGLFMSEANVVNRLFLDETYGIKLPSNKVELSKKMKVKLKSVFEKEAQLFQDHSILDVDTLTAYELLDTLKVPPPHPKLVMHILPPYSPNLNPIERVWKVMNEHVMNNKVFDSFAEFKAKIRTFFGLTWNTILPDLPSRINDKFQKLKPAISG